MKKYFISFLFVLALIVVASNPAHALQCKAGNFEASDECWTNVKVSSAETYVVSAGSVLVYDITTNSAQRNSFEVRLADASADTHLIAGIAQSVIATGDYGRVLVRGKGKLVLAPGAVVATGDRLYTSSSVGKAGTAMSSYVTSDISSGDPIAFALQASTAAAATIDAYITIL